MRYMATCLSVCLALASAPAWSKDEPFLESKVPSIQIHLAFKTGIFYTVSLYNISSRPVTSVAIAIPTYSADHMALGQERSRAHPSIPPGGSTQVGAIKLSDQTVVIAALFSDGTFEGNPEIAAELAGREVGREIQFERLNALILKILGNPDLDEAARRNLARTELQDLPVTADPEMLERARKEFPTLPFDEARTLQQLSAGLQSQRDGAINELEGLQNGTETWKNVTTLVQWWKVMCEWL